MLNTMLQSSFLFPSLVVFRVVNALLLKTHFEPDEYYQTIEVAMNLILKRTVFTWEWFFGIRSFVFVSVFLVPLKIFYLFTEAIDRLIRIYAESPPKSPGIIFMVGAPYVVKAVTAVISSIGDYSTIRAYMMIHSVSAVPQEIFLVSIFNLGQWLYSTRSHANSFESAVSIYVFYRLLRSQEIKDKLSKKIDYAGSVFISGLLAYIRPSSLISLGCAWIWALNKERLSFDLAWKKKETKVKSWWKYFSIYLQHSRILSALNVCVFLVSLGTFIGIDSLFYQELICSPWEFYQVNIQCKVSHLFGTLPFVYVLFFACVLLGAYTPMVLLSSIRLYSIEVIIPLVYTVLHGMISHKEMRFLLPILPYINITVARTLKETVSNEKIRNIKPLSVSFKRILRKVVFSKYVFLGNLLAGIIIGIDHQNISRPLDYLRKDCAERLSSKDAPIFILSTFNPYMLPMSTYLGHRRIVIRTIDNNPDITKVLEEKRKVKRFQNPIYKLRIQEHDIIDGCMVDNILNFGPLDYHYIIIDSKHSKEFEEKNQKFVKVHESTHARIPSHQSISIYKQAFK